MSLFDFYIQVVRALDDIGAPYMIVGAFGAISYGLNRGTHDVDIIVDLHQSHFDTLAARFPSPRYYADPDQMREGMELGIMFNLIDSEEGTKADLVPLSREPEYQEAFRRRIRRSFLDKRNDGFEAGVAQNFPPGINWRDESRNRREVGGGGKTAANGNERVAGKAPEGDIRGDRRSAGGRVGKTASGDAE